MTSHSAHSDPTDRIRSDAHVSRLNSLRPNDPILPLSHDPNRDASTTPQPPNDSNSNARTNAAGAEVAKQTSGTLPPPAPPPESTERVDTPAAVGKGKKPGIPIRIYTTVKDILFSSPFNILLVFVPAGIAVEAAGANPIAVFAINAVAIVPLAGLLAHATEAVAVSLGDAMGALLNVTFGNAVELIIFIIALVKNEIRIVQASLVGSILANLLLILGMCFLLGGLRFREQIYNSTVTQMSACLLSLSVTSLVLPTAFHASFSDPNLANDRVLQLSRGSSIILLLVYVLYLLFQLKSHAYMYESTPQHIIDEESHPGVLANMLNSSSSDDDTPSGTESDNSSGSHGTAKKFRRAFRRHRKSSVSSSKAPSLPSTTGSPSASAFTDAFSTTPGDESNKQLGAIASGDEADTDGEGRTHNMRSKSGIQFRDFENEKTYSPSGSKSPEKHPKKSHRRKHRMRNRPENKAPHPDGISAASNGQVRVSTEPASAANAGDVAFEPEHAHDWATEITGGAARRPFAVRTMTVRPTMPKILASTVFSNNNSNGLPPGQLPAPSSSVPRVAYGIRRTNSLPDRLSNTPSIPAHVQAGQVAPAVGAAPADAAEKAEDEKKGLSRTRAILLLLISTALVAVCAEFLVGSINYMVDQTPLSQAFIGLIVLPIVGNAAEHVTAVTVASKNKMDLAIGVAVGSSIQIALFVTPVVVLLGWMMNKEMSLYFSLFETVSLFVSAFIINFLILDGRSNYLEGSLLVAAYVIIAVGAFYYPNQNAQSEIGGASTAKVEVHVRALAGLVGL